MTAAAVATREIVVMQRHKDVHSPDALAAGFPLVRLPGDRYQMDVDRIALNVAAGLVWDPIADPVDWWTAAGRILGPEGVEGIRPHALRPQPGSLRIVQGCGYDPGQAAFRFHSALNECSKHASAFVRWGDTNPFCSVRQYDGDADIGKVRRMVYEADVVHCHVNYILIGNSDMRPSGLVVRHYHGSRPGGLSWVEPDFDDAMHALRVGARLSHVAEGRRLGVPIHWLPIPIPVRRYAALRASLAKPSRDFRIAHSPTRRSYKGTDVFLQVCDELRKDGLRIRPVLIENLSMGDALALKARCDAVFDSFWLGIQGSGLEGAAMGLPVIAGDPDVAQLYRDEIGEVPYTYAESARPLGRAIELLATDPKFRKAEAQRVHSYCLKYHDYQAVVTRYERLLDVVLDRSDVRTAD